MKKLFKLLGIILLLLIIAGGVFFVSKNEDRPTGEKGAKAEALAQKMLQAVNKTAWDTTRFVQWTFPRGHHYLWDKTQNIVQVKWDEQEVILNTKAVTGKAKKAGVEQTGDEANKAVQKAWSNFCNDSFWLLAFTKLYDPGVERSYVKMKDGRDGLMATYTSGGVTPGDSYLWILDEKGLPTSYKMWVKIIPIGGLEFTWQDWKELPTGAMVATNHKGVFPIPITNLKVGQSLQEIGIEGNPFL